LKTGIKKTQMITDVYQLLLFNFGQSAFVYFDPSLSDRGYKNSAGQQSYQ